MSTLYQEDASLFLTTPVGFTVIMLCMWIIGPFLVIEGGFLGGIIVFFSILSYYSLVLNNSNSSLTITDKELVWQYGIVSKVTRRINMSSVRTAEVYQSLFQRLVNGGNMAIWGSGDRPEMIINGLPDADSLNEIISSHSSGS